MIFFCLGGFRVFIGNLGSRTNVSDLKQECERYGSVIDCWVARNPPGFAFVLFKYGEDAVSAVRNMDGRMVCGQRVRVEHAKARSIYPRNAPTYGGYHGGESSRRRHSSDDSSHERSSRRKHKYLLKKKI
ncbi:unnamed protein product [Rotaria sp. Silwood1]|nr:unnamed protein product [Rotaria sp. Silwood1]